MGGQTTGGKTDGGAQERKHCTLSANKPGFVVISFCRARVQLAQHREENTEAAVRPRIRPTFCHENTRLYAHTYIEKPRINIDKLALGKTDI